MNKPQNKRAEFLYRLLGSIIGSFCREFGHENVKKILRFMVDYDPFWEVAAIAENRDILDPPWKRGDHDFMEE
ncbi:MAG: hypothetical protein PHD68_02240 [Rugosibacter sp.]|nr:hypothetical protein [Rugosibacter sp.]